ncbi:MAG: hypothetical protein RDV48_15735 [Candidatus Eremiobacteraeota bacterium]|nr:hypothetical protein [Candidatus Eremiobacteraeota bacterium]
MNDNSEKKMCWFLGAMGIGILLSISIFALISYCHSLDPDSDPRSEKVKELIHEAEQLLEKGKRGTYCPKQNRG